MSYYKEQTVERPALTSSGRNRAVRMSTTPTSPPSGAARWLAIGCFLPIVGLVLLSSPIVVVAGLSHENEIASLCKFSRSVARGVVTLVVVDPGVSSAMRVSESVSVVNVAEHVECSCPVADAWCARGANSECVWMKEFVIGHEEGLHRLLFPSSLVVGTLRQPLVRGEQLMGEKEIGHFGWRPPPVFDLNPNRTLAGRWVNIQPWRMVGHLHIGTFNSLVCYERVSVGPPLQDAYNNQCEGKDSDRPTRQRVIRVWIGMVIWALCMFVGGWLDDRTGGYCGLTFKVFVGLGLISAAYGLISLAW